MGGRGTFASGKNQFRPIQRKNFSHFANLLLIYIYIYIIMVPTNGIYHPLLYPAK